MAKFAAGFVGPRAVGGITRIKHDDTDFFLRLTQEHAAAIRNGERKPRHRTMRGRTKQRRRPMPSRFVWAFAGAGLSSILVSTLWMVL